jgi:hypothetical protein
MAKWKLSLTKVWLGKSSHLVNRAVEAGLGGWVLLPLAVDDMALGDGLALRAGASLHAIANAAASSTADPRVNRLTNMSNSPRAQLVTWILRIPRD